LALQIAVICIYLWVRRNVIKLFFVLLNHIHQPRTFYLFQLLRAIHNKIDTLNNFISDELYFLRSVTLQHTVSIWCSLFTVGKCSVMCITFVMLTRSLSWLLLLEFCCCLWCFLWLCFWRFCFGLLFWLWIWWI
jgi:hypothetical protein